MKNGRFVDTLSPDALSDPAKYFEPINRMEKGTAILFSNFIFIPLFKRLNSIYFPPSSLFFDEQILPSWQEKIKNTGCD
ncbi:hypothetical protein PO124_35235 [Bacillus licheniformis]|nr:hypothetical protein [Bacillus licheniformis]